ncbi:MAG: glutamate--tRNA ligase [Oscillospiraceae bacterium]|nr:glutamate--tRNA ligase [Oscillospiraceae bacterium]
MSEKISCKTRFAPSPTGFMHIGNLRTALYAYIIAKKNNGSFILRIEDTDQTRYVDGAVDVIHNTLRQCGLNWDEEYVQSERMGIYGEHAQKLIESGEAYYCFCTKERISELHASQQEKGIAPTYDRCCRDMPQSEADSRLNHKEPFVIRQKMPLDGETTFRDELFGDVTIPNSELEDQILIKSDGMPTYNFANVIDDHLMGITHIIRGNEYLSSTPKYNLLYQAFGWETPFYIHVNHIMRDANKKLSKREGDANFGDFTKAGYYIPAILNYIALLGWAPKGENEIYTLDELVGEFEISGLSKSPSIFDPVKMKAINAKWLQGLSKDEFKTLAMPYIKQACKREEIDYDILLRTLQPRVELLTDIPEKVDFIDAPHEYGDDLYFNKKMKTTPETAKEALRAVLPALESISESEWNEERLHAALMSVVEQLGVKNGVVLFPLRIALSGKALTPGGGSELAAILGRKETLNRLTAVQHIQHAPCARTNQMPLL